MLTWETLKREQQAHAKFIADKLNKIKSGKNAWSLQDCKEDAAKYSSKAEWKEANYVAYTRALYNGWLSQCCAHMPKAINPKPELTLDDVLEVAEKVRNYKEFRQDYYKYYIWALRNNQAKRIKQMILNRDM